MPADSNSRTKESAPRRRQIVQAFWPILVLLLVFPWNSAACKKKEEQEPAGGRKGARPHITYHYPTPQPTYTLRPGVTPNIQPE